MYRNLPEKRNRCHHSINSGTGIFLIGKELTMSETDWLRSPMSLKRFVSVSVGDLAWGLLPTGLPLLVYY